jgi:hypothetical protein
MSEELHELGLVTARLQLVQDLGEPLLTHLGEGLRRQPVTNT